MMNFLFGLAAGGLIACIATITAVRHPEIQNRLGLIPPALAAPPRPEARCPAPPRIAAPQGSGAETESLFVRRRFWYVKP